MIKEGRVSLGRRYINLQLTWQIVGSKIGIPRSEPDILEGLFASKACIIILAVITIGFSPSLSVLIDDTKQKPRGSDQKLAGRNRSYPSVMLGWSRLFLVRVSSGKLRNWISSIYRQSNFAALRFSLPRARVRPFETSLSIRGGIARSVFHFRQEGS